MGWQATRPQVILGTVPEAVVAQAPRWLTTLSNSMLERNAVQASSIELLREASPRATLPVEEVVPGGPEDAHAASQLIASHQGPH
jgi:hypothetical protein